jgi:hypothetical protein
VSMGLSVIGQGGSGWTYFAIDILKTSDIQIAAPGPTNRKSETEMGYRAEGQRRNRRYRGVVNIEEAAVILGVHERTVRHWRNAGRMPPVVDSLTSPTTGKAWNRLVLWREDDVKELAAKRPKACAILAPTPGAAYDQEGAL